MPRKRIVPESPIHIDTNRDSKIAAGDLKGDLLESRVNRSRKDRVFLTRCVAALLLILAASNFAPAAIELYYSHFDAATDVIPRWIYVQLFLAFLHVVYAMFLLQIPDWSALRSMSFLMLIFAALYGFVAATLLIGGAGTDVPKFLELPHSLIQRSMIWSVVMLFFELLGSYVAGVEAMNWKRMEQLFQKVTRSELADGNG